MPAQAKFNFSSAVFDARRDTIDFRDQMYTPTLVEVPPRIDLAEYQKYKTPILNQGQEGACTGFGLATVANYLLRRRKVSPQVVQVSPRMLYEMAKRYDEWAGENYSGSSARGAMKGWHKHGVCSALVWPYRVGTTDRTLTNTRAVDARRFPLGAYFRVNHKDLVAMHAAMAEVGILFATGNVHKGWDQVKSDGVIEYYPGIEIRGGHAFAIVAYDEVGFWIQNSWSSTWGKGGFARIDYGDWLANSMDVWVARLGVPVELHEDDAASATQSPGAARAVSYSYSELRPHVISLGNDGRFEARGTYGTAQDDVEKIFAEDIPRITQSWKKKRIFLYAHGGLVGEAGFLQRVADYRSAMLGVEVYPLAFVWHTDLWSTVSNILKEAVRLRKPEGVLDSAKDFLLDRLDDTLEGIVRSLRVRVLWDEMKENAWRATATKDGGARHTAHLLAKMMEADPTMEVHIAGHSAGSIFHAPLVQYLSTQGKIASGPLAGKAGLGKKVSSCTLWAPGVRISEFKQTYLPAIQAGGVDRFSLYTLTDEAERDDHCANIYHKSLLYMVARALEGGGGQSWNPDDENRGEPLLGMARFVERDADLTALFDGGHARWVQAPFDAKNPGDSKADGHGAFDDDTPTLMSTLATILFPDKAPEKNIFKFGRSSSSLGDRRRQLG